MIAAEISIGGNDDSSGSRAISSVDARAELLKTFNDAKEYKNQSIDEVRPAIEKLRDIVLELREELNTKDIGFEVATIAKLRSLGVQNGFQDGTYALISVKDAKFVFKIGANTPTYLLTDNVLDTNNIDFNKYNYRVIDLNETNDVKILKEFVARKLGQLTALDQLKKYDVPVGESPRHIFKPSMPKQ
jgi:hypothetical protein